MARRMVIVTALVIGVCASLRVPTLAQEANAVFIEAQTWKCKPGTLDCAHLHAGGWLPFYQRVSGIVPMPMDFLLHMVSGTMNAAIGTGFDDRVTFLGDPFSTTLKLSRNYPFNTGVLAMDGWTKWELNRARVLDTDGTKWFARLKAGFDVVNGKPRSTEKMPLLESSGWIDDRGYNNWRLPNPQALFTPKTGPWTITATPGSSVSGETRDVVVTLDPNVHAGNFGQVIFDRKNLPKDPITVTVPALDPGFHKVMLRVSDEGRNPGQPTIVGVLVIGFDVVDTFAAGRN